jgi:hypothetical protein
MKRKNMKKKIFFCILKVTEEGIGSGVGSRTETKTASGSSNQRCGSGSAPKCHGSPALVSNMYMTFFKI